MKKTDWEKDLSEYSEEDRTDLSFLYKLLLYREELSKKVNASYDIIVSKEGNHDKIHESNIDKTT